MRMLLVKFQQKVGVLLYDFSAIPVAWYLAYWLRYNLQPFPRSFMSDYALYALLTVMILQMGWYHQCKVYRGLWRFASLNDISRIIKASLYTVCSALPVLYLFQFIHHIPRSVIPLYAIILTTLWSSGRLLRRVYWDNRYKPEKSQALKRVLIVGGGDAGASLIRDLNRSPEYSPVGIVDDQLGKQGLEIHGVRVIGTIPELGVKTRELQVDLIFIAIPSVGSAQMRRIVEQCALSGVPFRTLPSLAALADGRVEVNALRAVGLEDLLGRDEVKLDWIKITDGIRGMRVMVTGGGGSIGSELCRQILKLYPAELMLVDHAEYQLYQIEQELSKIQSSTKLNYVLASVTDPIAMNHWLNHFKPQIVFHAAAYKHVPLLESRVRAAVLNNVIGTRVLVDASVQAQVEKFILISTDKAVNPTSVMGATKRIAEMYCQNINERAATEFITVRFGNVLGSAGSVVPLFQQQINEGGPLTVTHPDIERFFMTIPEASQLILQAMVSGKGGEIFVLDMGEPIKIRYLAEQMIRLSGKNIDITYTGLRPGEKLFEELFHTDELLTQTDHTKLYQATARPCSWSELQTSLRLLNQACEQCDEREMKFLVHGLVPELLRTEQNQNKVNSELVPDF